MLKNIPAVLSPELLKILCEMGHGDEIVLADANYPAYTNGVSHVVRADGIGANELLDAVLAVFPVDTFVQTPVKLMQVVEGDDYTPLIWDDFTATLLKYGIPKDKIGFYERYAFYEQAAKAYCIVETGEKQRYGNVILKKGVL